MPLSQLLPEMETMSDAQPILPAHIEDTIQRIARLQAEHRRNATPLQRTVEQATALIGRTTFVGGLTIVLVLWIAGNVVAAQLRWPTLDAPPFNWLQGAAGVLALYITVFILRGCDCLELGARLEIVSCLQLLAEHFGRACVGGGRLRTRSGTEACWC